LPEYAADSRIINVAELVNSACLVIIYDDKFTLYLRQYIRANPQARRFEWQCDIENGM